MDIRDIAKRKLTDYLESDAFNRALDKKQAELERRDAQLSDDSALMLFKGVDGKVTDDAVVYSLIGNMEEQRSIRDQLLTIAVIRASGVSLVNKEAE